MRNTQHAETTGGRRRRTEREAEVIVAGYLKSGLTQRVFAQRSGMSVSTLQYWLRRAHSRAEGNPRKARSPVAPAAISLLEVELAGPAPCNVGKEGGYEIELRNGVCLRLPENFGDGQVRRLLSLIKEVR